MKLAEQSFRVATKSLTPILAMFILASAAPGQTNYINYQETLIAADGSPLPPGQATVEVNIYDSAAGGTKVWGPFLFDGNSLVTGHAEQVNVMNEGRFNIVIGPRDTANRDISAAFTHPPEQTRYIELNIAGRTATTPRRQILSVPYAFQAAGLPDVSDTAAGNVGIGTSSPTEKLDVSGNMKISGTLNTGGKATLNSAHITGALNIGTSQLTTTNDELAVNSDFMIATNLEVLGDIEFHGKIENINIDEVHSLELITPGNTVTISESLNLSPDNYFCGFEGISWNSALGAYPAIRNVGQNGAWLEIDETSSWNLTVRANGDGMTSATVRCLKYR